MLNSPRDHDATENIVQSSYISKGRNYQSKNKSKFRSTSNGTYNCIYTDSTSDNTTNDTNSDLETNSKNESQLKKLDIQQLDIINPSILIIGKRESGKSWTVVDIASSLFNAGKIDNCIVISSIKQNYDFYKQKLNINVFDKYTNELIDSIKFAQIQRIESAKQNNSNPPNLLLVFEDCFDVSKNKSYLDLIFNTRHYKITLMTVVQHSSGFSPQVRSNFDFVFMSKDESISNQKRLYENYAGMYPNFKMFKDVFDKTCEDYTMFVIHNNNNNNANTIDNKIYSYKAKEQSCVFPKFVVNNIVTKALKPLYDVLNTDDTLTTQALTTQALTTQSLTNQHNLFKKIIGCNVKITNLLRNDIYDNKKINILDCILDCNMTIIDALSLDMNTNVEDAEDVEDVENWAY